MILVEDESHPKKHEENCEIVEYHHILEDIGDITFKDSENTLRTFGECKNKCKDMDHGGKVVTRDLLKDVNDLSTETLESLKNVRNYVSSIVHNSSSSILKTAQTLKSGIAKTNLFGYIANLKKNYNLVDSEEETIAPWVGSVNEEEAKRQILSLSENRKTFLRNPPKGVFEFDLEKCLPIAKLLLKEDPRLQTIRFELVPKRIKEDCFWRNYFYRISLIKKSFDICFSKLKSEGGKSKGCLSLKNLEEHAHECSDNESVEQMRLENEKGLKKIGERQKEDSFENILDTEIREINSSLHASTEMREEDWEKEMEELLSWEIGKNVEKIEGETQADSSFEDILELEIQKFNSSLHSVNVNDENEEENLREINGITTSKI